MVFKKIMIKLRRSLLCCSKHERKLSPDIGSPTDVRRIDISNSLPCLTDAQRKQIREGTSNDNIRLLSLRSHPPISPPSPSRSNTPTQSIGPNHTKSSRSIRPTNPFQLPPTDSASTSASTSAQSSSVVSSREPSMALLNAASKDLPSALPTPPRRTHHENSPPAMRMKSMWDRERRYSSDSTGEDELYENPPESQAKATNEEFMTLNREFDWEEKKERSDSTRMLSLTDGFEMQETMGGEGKDAETDKKKAVIKKAINATELGDSSESEVDSLLTSEQTPLVKC